MMALAWVGTNLTNPDFATLQRERPIERETLGLENPTARESAAG
jgi:hypothetical protein